MASDDAGAPLTVAALESGAGAEALALACAQTDPSGVAAAVALRRAVPAPLAALALDQAHLRRRARAKLGAAADSLLLTRDGLEQATRPEVARWRAERLRRLGARTVIDLGCGIGLDALAFARAGLRVVAVERDPNAAAAARHNLTGRDAEVVEGDAVDLAPALAAAPGTALFLDPARRTSRGRTWNVADFSPPWEFVEDRLTRHAPTVVKAAPGLPYERIPAGVEARWTGEGADTVELGLWHVDGLAPGRAVTLLPGPHDLGPVEALPPARPVGQVDAWLIEPHGAVLRSGLTGLLDSTFHPLAAGLGYLCGPHRVDSPFVSCFEVLEVLDASDKALRRWVREHEVGVLEIKCRGLDVDPAALRRRLRPRGPGSATLVLTPTPAGTRALVCRRA